MKKNTKSLAKAKARKSGEHSEMRFLTFPIVIHKLYHIMFLFQRYFSVPLLLDHGAVFQAAMEEGMNPVTALRSPEGECILGFGTAVHFACPPYETNWRMWLQAMGPEVLTGKSIRDCHPETRWLFTVGFDPDAQAGSEWDGIGMAEFRIPSVLYIEKGKKAAVLVTGDASEETTLRDLWLRISNARVPEASPTSMHETVESDQYAELARKAITALKTSDLQKVVPAFRACFDLSAPVSSAALLSGLHEHWPTCYNMLHAQGGALFFSATPELLFSVRNRQVHTMALAGTANAGTAEELLSDEKTLREHSLVVEMLTTELNALCSLPLNVGPLTLRSLGCVVHGQTEITGKLHSDRSALDLLRVLHPTPAVCGFPRDGAMRFIRESEEFSRGLYAGVAGWLSPFGDAEACVTIRSGLIRDRRSWFYAGAGVVAGSDPELESEEVALKLRTAIEVVRGDPHTR